MTVHITNYTTQAANAPLPAKLVERIERTIQENLRDFPEDSWFEIEAGDGTYWDLNLWSYYDEEGGGMQFRATLYPVKVVDGVHSTITTQGDEVAIEWEPIYE